jgi:hypothetical protein
MPKNPKKPQKESGLALPLPEGGKSNESGA